MNSTAGRVGKYNESGAGSELDAWVALCVHDDSEVHRGIPLKVTLVDGTCEVGTVVNFGALGCSSILVSETMGPIELDMTTPVVVGYIPTEDVIVSGSGASEVGTCCDRRSSSLVSDNREGLVVSCGAFHSKRDSSLSSKLIIARLIRSLIRSAFCTSSSTCSLGMK